MNHLSILLCQICSPPSFTLLRKLLHHAVVHPTHSFGVRMVLACKAKEDSALLNI